MPKSIPIALANDQAQAATTLCFLQKIGPSRSGLYFCLTSLDRDVDYDDGTGLRTYYAGSGMDPSQMQAAYDLSVDNSETQALIYPQQGLTEEMVASGELDAAPFVIYKINYLAPAHGHEVMSSGVIGEVRCKSGLVTFENRAYSQIMKQNSVVEVDSITCRAKFGSQPGEQRFPCMYDLTAEWVDFTVTAVGAENVRDFSTDLTQEDDYFAPGLAEWTTGDNVGMQLEVGAYKAPVGGALPKDATVSLRFTARKPIQIDDTGRIRRDCSKNFKGHNSCETFNNKLWFRGEPYIPVSDETAVTIPGASV